MSVITSNLMIVVIAMILCVSIFGFNTITSLRSPVTKFQRTDLKMAGFNFNFNFSPKAASGAKVPSNKKLCVITGTTSGLGLETARELLKKGDYYLVCACRDVEKMEKIAKSNSFPEDSYTVKKLDLSSFQSVKEFVGDLKSFKGSRPLDRLVCNAAVYQPALMVPKYTVDGIEEQLQTNHLSHFLLCNLLLSDLAKGKDPRLIIVGSITGNDNTVGGGVVYPLADLGSLKGLEQGAKNPISMVDGEVFNGAKGYKDSKLCNMMTVLELHRKYHKSTGITFSTMYPGCIATTQLFREKRQWFRVLFPVFMKYVTGGFVSENEAGQRLAQVVDDEKCKKSGIYWAWNGGAKTVAYIDIKKNGALTGAGGSGGDLFENEFSNKVLDRVNSAKVFEYSSKIVGVTWPQPGPESPVEQELKLKASKPPKVLQSV